MCECLSEDFVCTGTWISSIVILVFFRCGASVVFQDLDWYSDHGATVVRSCYRYHSAAVYAARTSWLEP